MDGSRDFPHKELTHQIIGAAIKVHRVLGPGLLESAYEICLADEMTRMGLRFEQQVPLPVHYEGRRLDCGYRLDFLVEGQVIVELKSIELVKAVHEAQLLTYLKLAQKEVGLIINFNSARLLDGVIRKAMSTTNSPSALSAPLR